jgi:actin related protein 2/3 complex, subunit 1A/1B
VAWHPNSVLLAAGSTDAHARVFSSFIKGVDERPEPTVWGERLPFNTVCGEYLNKSAGWVHGCAFSPSGNVLAFTAHDSSITVVYPSGPDQPPIAVVSVTTQLLPFMSLIWNGESEIIAAGYVLLLSSQRRIIINNTLQDCEAYRFQGNEQGWQIAGSMESKGRPGMGGQREESALNMFRQMDLRGQTHTDTQLNTVHQNTISTIRPYDEVGGSIRKFSSKCLSTVIVSNRT